MPSALATLLTIAGILYLLGREAVHSEARSPALWLPVMWMAITGSRFVSQWMDLGGGAAVGDSYHDGSPIDAVYFSSLIFAGIVVLHRRRVALSEVLRQNGWLMALAAYGLASVIWSEFPAIAGKRWIKTLGHPLMALVILTDANPIAALRTVIKRLAFILLPLSVLFIKYFPEYGRGFDAWTGEATNIGVGLTKNDLGYVCMISGIVFSWNLLTVRRIAEQQQRWIEASLSIAFLCITWWLLHLANSATSLATMCLGIAVLVSAGWPIVNRRYFGTFAIVVLLTLWGLDAAFDLYESIVAVLGRNPTLTDRTVLWADVLAMQEQPLLGYGFESFWLGERLDQLWAKWWWGPTQAHNGFIEIYLNLGLLGIALMALLLLSTFRAISRQMQTDLDFARLRIAFFFAIVLFNYTEAAFKGVHLVWTIFYIIAMQPGRYTPSPERGWGERS